MIMAFCLALANVLFIGLHLHLSFPAWPAQARFGSPRTDPQSSPRSGTAVVRLWHSQSQQKPPSQWSGRKLLAWSNLDTPQLPRVAELVQCASKLLASRGMADVCFTRHTQKRQDRISSRLLRSTMSSGTTSSAIHSRSTSEQVTLGSSTMQRLAKVDEGELSQAWHSQQS